MKTSKGDEIRVEVCDGDDLDPCVKIEVWMPRPDRDFCVEEWMEFGIARWRAQEIVADATCDPVLVHEMHVPASDVPRLCERLQTVSNDALAPE